MVADIDEFVKPHSVPFPNTLQDKVAFDSVNRRIFIDKRFQTDHLLLSWQERMKTAGNMAYQILPTELDEIVRMRAEGMRVESVDVDMDMVVRNRAMNYLCDAARYHASDMHIMLRGTHSEIQIVVNGELRVLARLAQDEGEAMVRSIYQGIAKIRDDSYKPLEVQNAQIPGDALPTDTCLTSVRIVRGPSYPESAGGAFMTLRLQYNSAAAHQIKDKKLRALLHPRSPDGVMRLGKMGFTKSNLSKLELLMDSPNGIVFFTGPTGSGKTTTLYEVLKELARRSPEHRQVTIEDPVEYPMEWAVQMNGGSGNEADTGAGYQEGIRTALRMAPKIIFLGEVRGPSVAEAALQAGLTGHKVLTTLHVNDPFQFVERLELMDNVRLNRRVFCDHDSVRGVVAQRLLPHLCKECSVKLQSKPSLISKRLSEALSSWGPTDNVRLQGPGCDHCNHSGSTSRFSVAEVLVMDERIMNDFIEHGTTVARKNYRAREGADPSMLSTSIQYALRGFVDPRAVEKNVNLIPMMQGNTHV
ncbi:MAG: ATPase, T2SS/T4P/T4SS family [Pseudomonadota bacterium]